MPNKKNQSIIFWTIGLLLIILVIWLLANRKNFELRPEDSRPVLVTDKPLYFLVTAIDKGRAGFYQVSNAWTGEKLNVLIPQDAAVSLKKYVTSIAIGQILQAIAYMDMGQELVLTKVNVYANLPKDKILGQPD